MKGLVIIFGVFLSMHVGAQEREAIQNFFLGAADQVVIEAAATKVNGEIEYADGGESDIDELNWNLLGQYAFNKQLNLGADFTRLDRQDDSDGLSDWELYARGRMETYLYELRYFFSPEDNEDDNAYSGGNHYWIKLGLFKYGWGFLATFQPEYEADTESVENVDVGSETILDLFYEHISDGGNTYGASVGTWHFDRGDIFDDDITYSFIRGYAAIPFGGWDIVPRASLFSLWNESDEVDDARRTEWELRLRKVF